MKLHKVTPGVYRLTIHGVEVIIERDHYTHQWCVYHANDFDLPFIVDDQPTRREALALAERVLRSQKGESV